MKTIEIKGKKYVMVNERLKYFRENFKDWALISEIVNLTEDSCVIVAKVINENGEVKATGFAQEDRGSSMINKTSFVENCETSAWGRALGNLGIGIDESIASAEEVNIAIAKQLSVEDEKVVGGAKVLTGGKYDGKTITEVFEIDPGYCEFCAKNSKSEVMRKNFQKVLDENFTPTEVEV